MTVSDRRRAEAAQPASTGGVDRPPGHVIREGRDSDAEGFIALIDACWAEYPGCILDVDGELPELRALATYFAEAGGALWAAERQGEIIGMAATRPLGTDDAFEICKVYVARSVRGTGLAHALLGRAEAFARDAGARRLVLWTDTRFETAHRFYEKRGFVRQGSIRILDDLSKSLEFRYAKPLTGLVVEALDAAATASAEKGLAALLVGCVADDASLGFVPPLAPATALAHWKGVSSAVALGKAVLLAAWLEGELVGTAQLLLDGAENGPHRAELAKLMVAPAARRKGVGRALLRRAEQAARGIGRRLLVLDARAGSPASALFRGAAWAELGTIPGFELGAGGAPQDAVFFWKALA
jgi:GNAT superfamily N-acetyltransferase